MTREEFLKDGGCVVFDEGEVVYIAEGDPFPEGWYEKALTRPRRLVVHLLPCEGRPACWEGWPWPNAAGYGKVAFEGEEDAIVWLVGGPWDGRYTDSARHSLRLLGRKEWQ